MINSEDLIDSFLPLLTQRTAQLLEQEAQKELFCISWQDNEANLDRGFSIIAKKYCEIAFEQLRNELNEFKECIQSLEIKTPDLKLSFIANKISCFRKIELKSGKGIDDCTIPGSTIGKLDLNTWVIYCKRSTKKDSPFLFRYGRYHLGVNISPIDKFQDRTPRPCLTWSHFQPVLEEPNIQAVDNDDKNKAWIKQYARAAVNRVMDSKTRYSWQDDLVSEIIKISYSDGEVRKKFQNDDFTQ